MTDDDESIVDFEPDAEVIALIRDTVRPYRMPTTAYVRPCTAIADEAFGSDGQFKSLADRYAVLTTELPLAGASMLRIDANGEIALIARLRAAAPWLEPAIASIDRQLRIQNWAGRPWIAWRPLCLTGPPGCGKSHLARLIGDLAGTGHATLDLAGTSDNRTLEGTARGWTSTQPCWPALVMSQTRTANPVLVLEEVEKAGGSARNGDPLATLLTMIEAETASRFWDKSLLAEVDLSHACWILTCNDAELLPPVLRSRLDIVAVEGPGPEHFDFVASAVVADLVNRWGIAPTALPTLPPRAFAVLRDAFARTRSVRTLRRYLEQLIAAMIPHGRDHTH